VLVINTVPDIDEAVSRANGTAFGLGSSVYSARRGPAIAARLRAGGTTINSVLTFVGMSSIPFGGVGESGFGRFHGEEGLREFSYVKSTARKQFGSARTFPVLPAPRTSSMWSARRLRLRYGRSWH
jgi:acyl-CoA reductase-like NAD-dependent aldehyde dehydrogenase